LDCPELSGLKDDYFRRFREKVAIDRIPVTGGIELTGRCNFNCVHCYVPEKKRKDTAKEQGAEQIIGWIDELADAGCLILLLTGGEALLRKDFGRIYTHARKRGIMVSVFTNGSTITGEHVQLFREYPPAGVEITVYGATEETYRKVTGVSGAYQRVMEGIRALHENGIRIKLKTVLMEINREELHTIERIARNIGAGFRFDPAIMPRLDGDTTPLGLRVSPETAVYEEFRDDDRFREWATFWEKSDKTALDSFLYACGAGRTCFHITAEGFLQPCLMAEDVRVDLSITRFNEAWKRIGKRISDIKAASDHPCRGCELITLCGYCPPFSKLETGSEQQKSDYICRIGHTRYMRISRKGEVK
jgi:radical SAM protein with 4Fe4S-binding SPASM domain